MRVLVAARLSRKADDRSQTGLETQDAEVLAWGAREGHEIVHVAADFKSGTTPPWQRPNLRPWVTEPSKIAQYDAVAAYRFDRLSRGDDRSTSAIEDWAYRNGKVLLTVDGLRFPCEGVDGIRWDLMKRLAHEEWLKISERYTRMRVYLKAHGYLVGRAPYGYRSVTAPGSTHKTLAPVPAEADVIRDVAAWYLEGASLEDIGAKLMDSGRFPRAMKRGHQPKWTASALSKVLHNEVIAGRQRNAAGATILKVEPILSREVWHAVIDRLAVRAKRSGVSQSKTTAMLTSIIVCTACAKAMYRGGPDNVSYFCRVKGCKSRIRVDAADAWVDELMRSDDRRDIIEVIVRGDGHETEIAEVKRDIAEAVEAEKFDAIPALRAELDRLRALPSSPTRVERRESDQTVAEMWATMAGDAERRAYLMERRAQVQYAVDERDRRRLTTNLGKPQSL